MTLFLDGNNVMNMELNAQQKNDQAAFRALVNEEILPYADQYDQEERIPFDLIRRLGREGYLGATLPAEHGLSLIHI